METILIQLLFSSLLITKAPNIEKSKMSEAELGEALGGQKKNYKNKEKQDQARLKLLRF